MRCILTFKIVIVLLFADLCKASPHEPHRVKSSSQLDEDSFYDLMNTASILDLYNKKKEELGFLYFKTYDSNRDDKLDGCEIIQSLLYWHIVGKDGKHTDVSTGTLRIFEDGELSLLIDLILESDDKNKDGFINVLEFIFAELRRLRNRDSVKPMNVFDIY